MPSVESDGCHGVGSARCWSLIGLLWPLNPNEWSTAVQLHVGAKLGL